MNTDTSLLERVLKFDEQALAEVYDQFSPGIYRYAMRLLGDPILAEDCVAETFSRFLGGLRNGNAPEKYLQAYLYRVAHNWITDFYRRQPPPTLPLEPDQHVDHDQDPAQAIHQQMEHETVRAALSLLTPEQRQVIMLRYLEDLPNEEIAQSLGKPIGAVKALQHRAIATLRRILLQETAVSFE